MNFIQLNTPISQQEQEQKQKIEYNPFNPLQSYLNANINNKQQINEIANQRISYFLDMKLSKQDKIYRNMLRNRLGNGMKNDIQYKNYMSKVTKLRDKSEVDVKQMRKQQQLTEQQINQTKNLRAKNVIKKTKITSEQKIINKCAEITDYQELRKQISQLFHVKRIKNFVQRIKQKKQISYLDKALTEIKSTLIGINKPIKYLINENKDPRALNKPLMVPVTDFKVVQLKYPPLNLKDDLTINFCENKFSRPHQLLIPKKSAIQSHFNQNEIITPFGFKIRQMSEMSILQLSQKGSKNNSPLKNSDKPVLTKVLSRKHRIESADKEHKSSEKYNTKSISSKNERSFDGQEDMFVTNCAQNQQVSDQIITLKIKSNNKLSKFAESNYSSKRILKDK